MERHIYRHPNGLAECYGFDHDLDAETYCANSIVYGRTVTCQSVITASVLRDCIIRHSALHRVSLSGVVVDGAKLQGPWELHGLARIHGGLWARPPKFLQITGENGLDVGLTECHKPGYAHISSRCHKISEWLKFGPRLGRRLGWTPEQVASAYQFIEHLDTKEAAA